MRGWKSELSAVSNRRSMHAVRLLGLLLGVSALTIWQGVGYGATRARFAGETVLNDAPTQISAGTAHNCQVRDGGAVRCWGSSDAGQVGPTLLDQATPISAYNVVRAMAITAGRKHTCALFDDGIDSGMVKCWGSNVYGQHGANNPDSNVANPDRVFGIRNAVAVSAGSDHTCALMDIGTVRCWGANDNGQLGDNSQTDRPAPVDVQGLTGVIAISAGGAHSCALLANGTVKCWGRNEFGELGDGKTILRKTPVVVQGISNAVAIGSGVFHTCALIADGSARCWGKNDNGQLGNNSTAMQLSPVPVVGLTNATSISAGGAHTCALLADGTARCWGWNFYNQLGDGSQTDRHTPVAVGGALSNTVAITAGSAHTCALLADGSARCWGIGTNGQIGNGSFLSSPLPTAVVGGGGGITARDAAAGRNHTCVVRANGTAACWGSDASGQVGDGATGVNRLFPVAVPGLTAVVAIAGGEAHTCALLANGTVRCWGLNSSGEVGDGTTNIRPSPVQVPGLANVVAIATGGDLGSSHTCALIADGTMRCWGANGSGQLGDNTTTTRLSPVVVQGLGNVVAIATGAFHTCALVADGTARCWGANNNGQLGNGLTVPSSVPVTVVGLGSAVSIASGDAHNCALVVDSTARCWGANLLGQLGNGSNVTPQLVPTAVFNLTSAVAIAAGNGHSCAVQANNRAKCWGTNTLQELGTLDTTSSNSPQAVLAGFIDDYINITTGRHHSCGLRLSGGVKCWGDNTFGQLGALTTSSSITDVPSLTLNIDPSVSVKSNQRVAEVTVIAICDEGQRLQFDLTITQDSAYGSGHGSGNCTGRLERYPVSVPALGPNPLTDGAATVSANAVIRGGNSPETQAWTRAVNVTIAP